MAPGIVQFAKHAVAAMGPKLPPQSSQPSGIGMFDAPATSIFTLMSAIALA
ncbi:MAG: hypothetical protein WD871_03205 [Xanthobacteraceae bacterium]